MKVIVIPPQEKLLTDLLEQARREEVVLQSADGHWFVLTAIGQWRGFDVGDSEDFEEEVARTSQNQELLDFLRERRGEGATLSLEDVKRELGLE